MGTATANQHHYLYRLLRKLWILKRPPFAFVPDRKIRKIGHTQYATSAKQCESLL
jgi:hypothetical protein